MDPAAAREPEILFNYLMERIGLALDPKGGRMFIHVLSNSDRQAVRRTEPNGALADLGRKMGRIRCVSLNH